MADNFPENYEYPIADDYNSGVYDDVLEEYFSGPGIPSASLAPPPTKSSWESNASSTTDYDSNEIPVVTSPVCSEFIFLLVWSSFGLIVNMAGLFFGKDSGKYHVKHLYLANMGSIISVPFIAACKTSASKSLDTTLLQLLSFTLCSAQASYAYQLLFLIFVRRRELNQASTIEACQRDRKLCSVIVVLALAVFGSLGVASIKNWISNMVESRTNEFKENKIQSKTVYLTMMFIFGFIGPNVTSMLILMNIWFKRRNVCEKRAPKYIQNAKEVAALYSIYVVLWLPYRTWQLCVPPYTEYSGYNRSANTLLVLISCYSFVLPIIQAIYHPWEWAKHSARKVATFFQNFQASSGVNADEADDKLESLRDQSAV